jgi:hypothetical protein
MTTVEWNGAEMEQRIRAAAMRGVASGLGMVEDHTVDLILNTQKTGRVYRRRGVVHQASAPGEPPASDLGTLVNSRHIELHPETLSGLLIWSSLHAWFMEHGTKHIEPRPFARRGLAEKLEDVQAGIANEVRAVLPR